MLLDNLRLLEGLQGYDQFLDSFVDLVWLSGEDVLEVFIGGAINLLRALSRANLAREQDRVLSDKILDLILNVL